MHNQELTIKQRPDGLFQLDLGLPKTADFPHKERWSVRDAALMSQSIHRQMRGSAGWTIAAAIELAFTKRAQHRTFNRERAQQYQQKSAQSWDPDTSKTILSDQAFAEMMIAAAISSPDVPLLSEDLISDSGTVFFETPVDLSSVLLDLINNVTIEHDSTRDARYQMLLNTLTKNPIRGLHWAQYSKTSTAIELMTDGPNTEAQAIGAGIGRTPDMPLDPPEFSQYLARAAFGVSSLNATPEQHMEQDPTVRALVALLRSFKAVLDSSLSTQTTGDQVDRPRRKKSRGKAARKALDTSRISVVSLTNKNHGRYELDAATGRKIRAHWVRGHWRQQWYSSVQEHRTIWIDGFTKGDPQIGSTSNTVIYTARAPRTDTTEGDS